MSMKPLLSNAILYAAPTVRHAYDTGDMTLVAAFQMWSWAMQPACSDMGNALYRMKLAYSVCQHGENVLSPDASWGEAQMHCGLSSPCETASGLALCMLGCLEVTASCIASASLAAFKYIWHHSLSSKNIINTEGLSACCLQGISQSKANMHAQYIQSLESESVCRAGALRSGHAA